MVELKWVELIQSFKGYMEAGLGPITLSLEAGDFSYERLTRNKFPMLIFKNETDLILSKIGARVKSEITVKVFLITIVSLVAIDTRLKALMHDMNAEKTLGNIVSNSKIISIDAYLAEDEKEFVLPFNSGFNVGSMTIMLELQEV